MYAKGLPQVALLETKKKNLLNATLQRNIRQVFLL